jgi:photosystem II stability/assembly factor-like uncharacterized protein
MSHKMSKSHLKHFVVHSILVLVLGSCNSEVAVTPTDNIWGIGILPTASPPTQVSTSTPRPTHIATSTVPPMPAPTLTKPTETSDPWAVKFSYDFQMISETVGWAIGMSPLRARWGRRILRTSDGGFNWQDVSPLSHLGTNEPDPSDFIVLDGDHAWLLRGTYANRSEYILTVWSTQNGGQTWQQADLPFSNYDPQAQLMTFEDAQHGSLEVSVPQDDPETTLIQPFKTSDGGQSWQALPILTKDYGKLPDGLPAPPNGTDFSFSTCFNYSHSQTFFSAKEGIFQVTCNDQLFIYHTYDGGQTWDAPAYREGYSHVDFVDMNNGWYHDITMDSSLYVTYDGGKTFREIIPIINVSGVHDFPAYKALDSFNFIDKNRGWVLTTVGFYPDLYSVLLKTTDGGYTWNGWVPHLLPAEPGH